mgnify:CR=1 FL=1
MLWEMAREICRTISSLSINMMHLAADLSGSGATMRFIREKPKMEKQVTIMAAITGKKSTMETSAWTDWYIRTERHMSG